MNKLKSVEVFVIVAFLTLKDLFFIPKPVLFLSSGWQAVEDERSIRESVGRW